MHARLGHGFLFGTAAWSTTGTEAWSETVRSSGARTLGLELGWALGDPVVPALGKSLGLDLGFELESQLVQCWVKHLDWSSDLYWVIQWD